MMSGIEYRVIWKRKGLRRKVKKYATRQGADRFITLLGPEPWKAYNGDADDYWCCRGGPECGCDGITVREAAERDRNDLPPIEYGPILEQRPVGDWGDVEE